MAIWWNKVPPVGSLGENKDKAFIFPKLPTVERRADASCLGVVQDYTVVRLRGSRSKISHFISSAYF